MTGPSTPPDPGDEWSAIRGSLDPPAEPARHPARNRGTHAAPPTVVRTLTKSLIVVALVAAGVALLVHWRGTPTGDDGQGPVVALPTLTPTATATPTATPTAQPTHRPSPKPTRAHPTPTQSPATVVAVAPLTVLNNSTISGLAAQSAEEFHAKGWPIAAVGNFTGRVAETTVYYTPGADLQRQAAQRLARQFPGITRVNERFDGLPGSGVTVVLTRYYAG
jgi:hypothetical protein